MNLADVWGAREEEEPPKQRELNEHEAQALRIMQQATWTFLQQRVMVVYALLINNHNFSLPEAEKYLRVIMDVSSGHWQPLFAGRKEIPEEWRNGVFDAHEKMKEVFPIAGKTK